jgi:hypothetical protein
MHYIDFPLDGVQPFRITNNTINLHDGLRLDIELYGNAVIAIADREDWYLDELTLKATNGKMGAEAEGWDHEIESDHFFFKAVEDYLYKVARADVEEAIEAYAVAQWEERDAMARDY